MAMLATRGAIELTLIAYVRMMVRS